MPFQKGQSGNPGGRPVNDRAWSDAIRLAAFEAAEKKGDVKKIRKAAEKLVEMALDGDMAALREFGDRLEGKPAQTIQHSGHMSHSDLSEEEIDRRLAELEAKTG